MPLTWWRSRSIPGNWKPYQPDGSCSNVAAHLHRRERPVRREIHKVSSPLAYAGYVSSFTYPWRRLVLKSLMMGLNVEVENVRNTRRTFQPENFRAFALDWCSDWLAVGLVTERSVEAIRVCSDDSATPP